MTIPLGGEAAIPCPWMASRHIISTEARFVRSAAPGGPVRVVLHTNERVTAEALRLALLAEGIDASVRGQHLRVLGLPLTVAVHHNEEYEHAVRIREAMELDVVRSKIEACLEPRRLRLNHILGRT